MSDPIKRLSAKYLRKIAEAVPDEEVPINRFLDLVPLVLAYGAYIRYLEQTGADDETGLINKGNTLIKRYFPQLLSGMQYHVVPLGERSDAGPLRVPLRAALRAGSPPAVAQRQAVLFTFLFPWLRKRGQIFTTMFTGRAAKSARNLAIATMAESPTELVHALATIAPISGLMAPRKWIKAVAETMGVEPSNVEQVLTDTTVAGSLGEKLADVEAQQAATTDIFETKKLAAEKQALLDQIQEVADESPSEGAVLAAAAATQPVSVHVTEIGKRLGHTPDQEQAMMVQGRAIIAAGAGSGKTRVLASKVAYHINELGMAPTSILATTFTTKASAELIKRVRDYGAVIEDRAEGFGTTHSIAGKFLNKKATAFRRPAYIGKKEGWKQNILIRLAMDQVAMPGGGDVPAPPHRPQGLWDNVKPRVEEGLAEYQNTVRRAIGYFQWASRTFGPQRGRDYADLLPFLQEVVRRNPSDLQQWEKDEVNRALSMMRGKGQTNYRVSAESKRNKLEDYVYHKKPARRWFNLGRVLTRKNNDGSEQAVPLGEFKNAISIMKGKGLSPSEIWHGEGPYPAQSDHAAVYAAYEWLKGDNGEPKFAGTGDMDDILIDTVGALAASPNLRRQMQQQYKVLLIDEAQDLNRVQHLMFGLIAGHLDPDTLKPRADGAMSADTYCLIGDDKQCVSINAPVATPNGTVRAGDLQQGDTVLSYRNGDVVPQTVNHVVLSNWEEGLRVTTLNDHTLDMTPNHRLWATEPRTEEGEVAVYLMYRKDMGFRVGVTNKGKVGAEDGHLNSYGGRCFLELAERLWVLDICPSREEALYQEYAYSLQYGIPTMVFNGTHRGLDQDRIQRIFQQFGQNGVRLLEDRHLSLEYPHWMSQSYTKHGRERHTLNVVVHSSINSQVAMEWSGDKFDAVLSGISGIRTAPNDRRRLRRWFANYREALEFVQTVKELTDVQVSYRLSTPEGMLREIPASGLFVGMSVPVLEEGQIVLDQIVSIEKVPGQFLDLDIGDASNFFAGSILTHNSIYEFRGADPEEFIDKSDLVDGGEEFKTKILDTNFRSARAIVDSANRLIAYNKRQVPMTCKANVDRNGEGAVVARTCADTEDAAASVASEIEELIEAAQPGAESYKDFGVAVRSNAEAYHYGLEMLKRGIPFKSNASFFNDPNTKALIGWLTIVEKGLDGPAELIEEALVDCVRAPYSRLGKAFFNGLQQQATGSWARWLVDGGWRHVYRGNRMDDVVQHFTSNLLKASKLSGSPEGVLEELMVLKGLDGNTLQQSLIHSVEENDDVMAELSAEAEGGTVTSEQILERAMAPIEPLQGLMRGREDLDGAMDFVRRLKSVNQKISSKDTDKEIDRAAVTIGTMHSWKGLEVPSMYVPVVGSKFPRAGQDGVADDTPDLHSERRLAYVAITRAEQRCVLLDIPHPKFETHSQFLQEACVPTEGLPAGAEAVPKQAGSSWNDSAMVAQPECDISWMLKPKLDDDEIY